MNFTFGQNSVVVHLTKGERFFLARKRLRGIRSFDTRWLPPFATGSPFVRWYYGSYWRMREVQGTDGGVDIPITGSHSRGNFYLLRLEPGQKYYVSGHCIAGFSERTEALHTHIRFQLPFWYLTKHFFPVFEGSGEVLLYSESAFEETTKREFQPSRIAAFNIGRRFEVMAPQPTRLFSKIANLFSIEVIWRFVDEGTTVAELHSTLEDEDEDDGVLWTMFKHMLAWLRW